MVVFHRVHRELLSHTIGNARDTHPGKLMVVFHRVHRELLSHTIGNSRDTHPGKLMVVFHRVCGELLQPAVEWTGVEGQQTVHAGAEDCHVDKLTQHAA